MGATQTQRRAGSYASTLVVVTLMGMAAVGWAQPVQAHAATICSEGGTPAAPTGTFTIRPGLTTLPAPEPLDFKATAELAGDDLACSGTVTYTGEVGAGSSCFNVISFYGTVKGLPGVERFWGDGHLIVPEYLYDKAGNLVGLHQPSAEADIPYFAEMPCNTAEGFNHGRWSGIVELFGDER
jgi:hypothetical protein